MGILSESAYICQTFNQLLAPLHTVTQAAVGQSFRRHVHSSDTCNTACSEILWESQDPRLAGPSVSSNKGTGNTSHHVWKRLWQPPSLLLLYERTYRAWRFEDSGNNNARFQVLIAVFLMIRIRLGVTTCRRMKSGNRSCTFMERTQKTLYNEQTKIFFDSNCWRTCKAAESRDRLTHWKLSARRVKPPPYVISIENLMLKYSRYNAQENSLCFYRSAQLTPHFETTISSRTRNTEPGAINFLTAHSK